MSPRESNQDRLSCHLQGSSAVKQASQAARSFGEAQWLADDELARLCIIVEELVANLYDHGGLTDQHVVELDFASNPDGVRIVIFDPGNPFDPWAAPGKAERPERGGGAGIDIIRAWAQFVSYQSSGRGNRLELLLPVRWDG